MSNISEIEKLSVQLNVAVASVLSISNSIQSEILRLRSEGVDIPVVSEVVPDIPVLPAASDVAVVATEELPTPVPTPDAPAAEVPAPEVQSVVPAPAAEAPVPEAQPVASSPTPANGGRRPRRSRLQILQDIDAGLSTRPLHWTAEDEARYRIELADALGTAPATTPAPEPVEELPAAEVKVPDNGLLTPVTLPTSPDPDNPDIEYVVDAI
jgi:hypothetical protein